MQLDVTVQIEGEDVLAGRLCQNVRHGDETESFSYPRHPSTTWQTVSRPVFAS